MSDDMRRSKTHVPLTVYPTSYDNHTQLYDVEDNIHYYVQEHHNALKDAIMALQKVVGLSSGYNFLLRDGTQAMTGDLDMGSQNILLGDNNYIRFGAGSDCLMRHDGSDFYMDVLTGDLHIDIGGSFYVRDRDDVDQVLFDLDFDSRVFTIGAASDLVNTMLYSATVTIYNQGAGSNPVISANAAAQQLNITGILHVSEDAYIQKSLRWRDGTSFYGIFDHANTVDRTYTFPDASITVAGINYAQTWTANQTFQDSVMLRLGTDTDFDIYHDGSHAYLVNTTGHMYLQVPAASNFRMRLGGQLLIQDLDDSNVTLFDLDTTARTLIVGGTADTVAVTIHDSLAVPAIAYSGTTRPYLSLYRTNASDTNLGPYIELGLGVNDRFYIWTQFNASSQLTIVEFGAETTGTVGADVGTYRFKVDGGVTTLDLQGDGKVQFSAHDVYFAGGTTYKVEADGDVVFKDTTVDQIISTLNASGDNTVTTFKWNPADLSGAEISIGQGTSDAANFIPTIIGTPKNAAKFFVIRANVQTGEDTGSIAPFRFQTSLNNAGAISTRPAFSFYNWATELLTLGADGRIDTCAGFGAIDVNFADGTTYKVEADGDAVFKNLTITDLTVNGCDITGGTGDHLRINSGNTGGYIDIRPNSSDYGLIIRQTGDTTDYVNIVCDDSYGYISYVNTGANYALRFTSAGAVHVRAGFSVGGTINANNHQIQNTERYTSNTENVETVSGNYSASKMVYAFNEARGWGYNSADDVIYAAMSTTTPFRVTVNDVRMNVIRAISDPDHQIQMDPVANEIRFYPGDGSTYSYFRMSSTADDQYNPTLYPDTTNQGFIGKSACYFSGSYTYNVYFKYHGTFEHLDDLAELDAWEIDPKTKRYKFKSINPEILAANPETGEPEEWFSLGKISGFALGCIKQLHGKHKSLEKLVVQLTDEINRLKGVN